MLFAVILQLTNGFSSVASLQGRWHQIRNFRSLKFHPFLLEIPIGEQLQVRIKNNFLLILGQIEISKITGQLFILTEMLFNVSKKDFSNTLIKIKSHLNVRGNFNTKSE